MPGLTCSGRKRPCRTGVIGVALLVPTLVSCTGEPGGPGGSVSANAGASSASARPGVPFLPEERMSAPEQPPGVAIASPVDQRKVVPRRVAFDWSARGGGVELPPDRVDWPVTPIGNGTAEMVFGLGTEQVPSRVVFYEYSDVGESGVPEEDAGTESLCGYEDPANRCYYEIDRERRNVRLHVPIEDDHLPYWVLQAAWPVPGAGGSGGEEPREGSVSWLLRVDRP
ncbi:hypothetical protein GCM10012275_53660 [Longimycelium tulufanense]|uniref:Uncharacterized protein n=1 Tax=Longimycelium tulufanense TaxID=907463 RepID=A0A8J3FYI6_9PSEU|nr:hypothetical protein [Longimycelium tulufanense]GGM76166.1 hypothetical protein GCM10012275_53660 [Longimycelium tulufanense]